MVRQSEASGASRAASGESPCELLQQVCEVSERLQAAILARDAAAIQALGGAQALLLHHVATLVATAATDPGSAASQEALVLAERARVRQRVLGALLAQATVALDQFFQVVARVYAREGTSTPCLPGVGTRLDTAI
ncbi:MAG: hypothetical protein HY320_11925 [Armatimonadetes bacterium]|nr:hypothetical protein [Armatimonadota bacterium]